MTIHPHDILFDFGGAALRRYRSITRRVASVARKGEEAKELWTRNTSGLFVRRDGFLGSSAVNVPRIERLDLDGDGIWETPALLVENGGSSGWDRTEELDHANWVKGNATVSANAIVAPDGQGTADFLDEGAASAFHYFERACPALTNNTRSTVTVFCRQTTGSRWLRLLTRNKANVERSTWFNPGTGAVGTTDSGHVVFVTRSALVSGGYFWRFGVSFDAASGATSPVVQFIMTDANNGGSYQGVPGSGLYFWGMNINADQASPASYIKGVAAAGTLDADVVSIPLYAAPQTMTIYVNMISRAVGLGSHILTVSDVAQNNPNIRLADNGNFNGSIFARHHNGTVFPTVAGPVVAWGSRVEYRLSILPNGSIVLGTSIALGAESLSTDATAAPFAAAWSGPAVQIYGGGPYIRLMGVRGAPTMAELRAALPTFGPPYS